jgi:hypothetical protein
MQFIQRLDGINSDGNDNVRKKRKDLIKLAQAHDSFLDSIVRNQWEQQIMESEAMQSLRTVARDSIPKVFDCCAFFIIYTVFVLT